MSIFRIFRHRLSKASVWDIRGWGIGRRSSSIVAHNINSSDHEEIARLNGLGFNEDF